MHPRCSSRSRAQSVLPVPGGQISAVNLAEVTAKLISRGMPKASAMDTVAALDLEA